MYGTSHVLLVNVSGVFYCKPPFSHHLPNDLSHSIEII